MLNSRWQSMRLEKGIWERTTCRKIEWSHEYRCVFVDVIAGVDKADWSITRTNHARWRAAFVFPARFALSLPFFDLLLFFGSNWWCDWTFPFFTQPLVRMDGCMYACVRRGIFSYHLCSRVHADEWFSAIGGNFTYRFFREITRYVRWPNAVIFLLADDCSYVIDAFDLLFFEDEDERERKSCMLTRDNQSFS